jgi:hypothetical protein
MCTLKSVTYKQNIVRSCRAVNENKCIKLLDIIVYLGAAFTTASVLLCWLDLYSLQAAHDSYDT